MLPMLIFNMLDTRIFLLIVRTLIIQTIIFYLISIAKNWISVRCDNYFLTFSFVSILGQIICHLGIITNFANLR